MRHTRLRFAVLLFMLWLTATTLSSPAPAAEQFRIDPNHTFVYFAVVHTGVSSVRGRFNVPKGSASFDAGRQEATFTVEIDARSLDTGVKQLDGILTGETFFDTAKFRTALFSGRGVRFAEGVPLEFEGDLTVKGVTRPVRLTAERFVCQQVNDSADQALRVRRGSHDNFEALRFRPQQVPVHGERRGAHHDLSGGHTGGEVNRVLPPALAGPKWLSGCHSRQAGSRKAFAACVPAFAGTTVREFY